MRLIDKITSAWNVFRDPDYYLKDQSYTGGSTYRPGRRVSGGPIGSDLTNAIFNRIALDVAMVELRHVKNEKTNNEDGSSTETSVLQKSGLQNCFETEFNIDQSTLEFMHDLVFSLFDEGVIAVVPIDTDLNPQETEGFNIYSMRIGKIVQWYPQTVRVRIYNEKTGLDEEVEVAKRTTAIIENPLYSVINGPNSTLQRITRKLRLMDTQDDKLASGKLDLILQLPYAVKSDIKRKEANRRIEEMETQLGNSAYGIAYADGTEKITQLNRPLTNNLLDQIKYLKEDLYNQLGMTNNVLNGTANEAEMRTYYSRTIDPVVSRIVLEFKRKFISKTARTQGQTILAYRDPFKLVPVEKIAEIADKFSRNEILSSNEIRAIVGFKPSSDPKADRLENRNIANRNQYPYGIDPYADQVYQEEVDEFG